jgi:hypothetical protein
MRAIIAAMDGVLQPPSVTAFDAAASVASLLVYLAVALAAIARAPRDARARTFLAVAVPSASVYALSPAEWWKGSGVYTPAVVALAAAAFAIGGIALLHFTQVFPDRRPWILRHFSWMAAAYALLPPQVAAIVWMLGSLMAPIVASDSAAGGMGAVSVGLSVLVLMLIPALLIVAVVVPLAGVMSLYKSWQEARADGRERERRATLWMLISQLGGGVLAVLVLPVLSFIGIGPLWSQLIAALTYAFALLLPIAFYRYTVSTSA